MKIVVLLKMVPDVVEELEVADDGKSLNADFLRMILSERDSHALEEGLLLKERHGGTLTVVAPDAPEVDNELFTALAKGADRAVKVILPSSSSSRAAVAALIKALPDVPGLLPADLILTGCQAIDDWDGMAAPLLADARKLPYVGLVTKIAVADGSAVVTKEYAGGFHGEFELKLPAVLGVQAAEQPPRYCPVAKMRAAMKTMKIEEVGAPEEIAVPPVEVSRLAKPVAARHAEMMEGSPQQVAGKICEILVSQGVV
jgi:electron transfer flavoprotein beta subunit